ncbi:MAG TPA: hypothetical protein VI758_07890, partial [Bacteroidota bacterium]
MSTARAQFSEPSNKLSRLTIENTAEILPASTFGFQTSAPLFNVDQDPSRARAIVGVGGIAEVDITDAGFVRNMMDQIDRQSSWGLKCRLFSAGGDQTVGALMARSSITWNSVSYYWYEVERIRPDLFRKGLGNVSYEYGYTVVEFIVTEKLKYGILLNGGLGIQ